jgi:phytoene dehydrogenase-like protein
VIASLTRRELLAAFLGAPFLAACRAGRPAQLPFEGELLGNDVRIGHRLRAPRIVGSREAFAEGPGPPSAAAAPESRDGLRTSRTSVLIVGAGVAGLSAAWRLERAGVRDFRILELERDAGGTARGGRGAISPYPWGAHYVPCPLPHARVTVRLLEELGAVSRGPDGELVFDDRHLCRAPQERLFVLDRWYEGLFPRAGASANDRAERARFDAEIRRLAALRDGRGRKAFAIPHEAGADDTDLAALDRVSAAEWLDERGFRSARLRWWLEYGCRDDYGADLAGTSAWAALHYHAARSWDGGDEDVLTWPEGNARVVGHLERVAGARLETGALVTRISPPLPPRGAEVTVVWHLKDEVERIQADHVILAIPHHVAARVFPHPRVVEAAKEFRSGAWLTANVTLRRRPRSRGFPECWDNVLHGSSSLGYVVATHQSDRHGGPPGATVWTWYLSLTDADARAAHRWLAGLTWREAADLVVTDLRRAHPDVEECISRLDVWRWGHAMIRPRPGFVFSDLRRRASERIGDVHFAHSDLSALPLVEEAQWHGVRAAEEVLARRGVRVESWR